MSDEERRRVEEQLHARAATQRQPADWRDVLFLLQELARVTAERDEVVAENAQRGNLLDYCMGLNAPVLKAERDAAIARADNAEGELRNTLMRERDAALEQVRVLTEAAIALEEEGVECLGRPERCDDSEPCGACRLFAATANEEKP